MLRLCNELHACPDALSRKRKLVEGLCGLVGARTGMSVVVHVNPWSGENTIVSVVRAGLDGGQAENEFPHPPEPVPWRAADKGAAARARQIWLGPPDNGDWSIWRYMKRPSRSGLEHCLYLSLSLGDSGIAACVRLRRDPAKNRPFTRTERCLIDLFHFQMGWIYRPDLALASSDSLSLSPRQRQTLQLLLGGQSEKQIAAEMQLSPNTVHHYVKALHRHFRVSSRSELLARWLK